MNPTPIDTFAQAVTPQDLSFLNQVMGKFYPGAFAIEEALLDPEEREALLSHEHLFYRVHELCEAHANISALLYYTILVAKVLREAGLPYQELAERISAKLAMKANALIAYRPGLPKMIGYPDANIRVALIEGATKQRFIILSMMHSYLFAIEGSI